jgi:tetratricopeptide (TPR) repeat protein
MKNGILFFLVCIIFFTSYSYGKDVNQEYSVVLDKFNQAVRDKNHEQIVVSSAELVLFLKANSNRITKELGIDAENTIGNINYIVALSFVNQRKIIDALPYFEEAYNWLLKGAPRNRTQYIPGIVRYIGETYTMRNRNDESLNIYQRYLNDWNDIYADNKSSFTFSGKTYLGGVKEKEEMSHILVAVSRIDLAKEDTIAAIKHLNESVSIYPTSVNLGNRGDLFYQEGNKENAINDYKEFVIKYDKVDEYKDKRLNILGEYYYNKEDYDNAYKYFSQISKKNAEQYSKMAFSSYKLNKLEEANRLYYEATKLDEAVVIDTVARQAAKQYTEDILYQDSARKALYNYNENK